MIGLITSTLASTLRGWHGTSAQVRTEQPAKPLHLYDMEACPYCRPVREYLTELDLDAIVHPCPKGLEAAWNELEQLGGQRQVPFLVDDNTGIKLYESQAILEYLETQYGGRAPAPRRPLLSMLASATRLGAGGRFRGGRRADEPLELFSFESSPFSRPVREKLSELGLPYRLRNGGKQQRADMGVPGLRPVRGEYQPLPGTKRAELLARGGKVQFPFLFDPNTNTSLFESKQIVRYLEQTYGR